MISKCVQFILRAVFFVLVFSSLALADTQASFCTVRHIREAIKINLDRRPLYAQLTRSQSLPISNSLIAMEVGLLEKAYLADFAAGLYQLAGVPVLCREFVSMELVPNFSHHSPQPWPSLENYLSFQVQDLKFELTAANSKNDFAAVLAISKDWLLFLNREPNFHCLTRHFIESIARAAALAPKQDLMAKRNLGFSSLSLSRQFVSTQIHLLDQAQELDRRAAPLQASGVPIICQDIPKIEIPE